MFGQLPHIVRDYRETKALLSNYYSNLEVETANGPSDFEGYPVFVSDTLCATAGMPPRIPGACVIQFDGTPAIAINKELAKQPQHLQDAILFHELGHIKMHRKLRITKFSLVMRMFVEPDYEYEADAYANQRSDHFIAALKMMESYGFNMGHRIRRLIKK